MKRFDLITESDALRLEPGSSVELAAGGRITPLARDTLRERRVTVLTTDGSGDTTASLAPATPMKRLAIGCDHTGVALKRRLVAHLRGLGLSVDDQGTDSTTAVDYPDVAAAVGLAVARGEADGGIVIDGAGIGSAVAANKINGVRAAMCPNETIARYSREHNGCNVMTLGSTLVTADEACRIVDVWLGASMKEPRYIRRLAKIHKLEREQRRQ